MVDDGPPLGAAAPAAPLRLRDRAGGPAGVAVEDEVAARRAAAAVVVVQPRRGPPGKGGVSGEVDAGAHRHRHLRDASGEDVADHEGVGFDASNIDPHGDDDGFAAGRAASQRDAEGFERGRSSTNPMRDVMQQQASELVRLDRERRASEARAEARRRQNIDEEIAERAERARDREAAAHDRAVTARRFWWTLVVAILGLGVSAASLAVTLARDPQPVIVPPPVVEVVPPSPSIEQPAPAQPNTPLPSPR